VNNFQIVFKNTLYLTTSEILLKVFGLLWVIFLAHSLTVELYGRYSLVNSFIAIFSFLPDLGVGLIVIREIARNKKEAATYLGNSFFLNSSLGLLTLVVIYITALLFHYPLDVFYLIGIAGLTLFISTLRSVGIFYFDGMEKMHYSAILNTLNTMITLICGFIAVLLGYGLPGIFWGMLIGTLISLTVTWLTVRRYTMPKFAFNRKLIKHIFMNGFPLGIAAFAALIYTRVDTILLNQILGEHAVGIYNSATPFIFALISLLNVPFVVAVYPTLSRLSELDHTRFKNAIKKSFGAIALWSIPAAVGVSLFAQVIPLIFGEKYSAAVPLLRLLIFVVPFASFSALLYKILIVLHKQKAYLYISIVGAVLSVVLNLLLIPKFSTFGAVYSSLLTQISMFILYLIVFFIYLPKYKKT
jgi:O-antigen/teichoic acid export membrane protein